MKTKQMRMYMQNWNKYTYKEGLKFCKDIPYPVRNMAYRVLGIQKLSLKLMNGYSVQGIPYIDEGGLKWVSFSKIFDAILRENFLTPAYYIVKIVEFCMDNGITDSMNIASVVGRGLRALPAFFREIDLAEKLEENIDNAYCTRTTPEDDIVGHTDIFLIYFDKRYRIWSYQNSSERALNNTISKLRGDRGSLPVGYHLLCPFDFMDKNDYEDVFGWRLYGTDYSARIEKLILSGKTIRYSDFLDMSVEEKKLIVEKENIIEVYD